MESNVKSAGIKSAIGTAALDNGASVSLELRALALSCEDEDGRAIKALDVALEEARAGRGTSETTRLLASYGFSADGSRQ